ncbi:MAG: alkaline phosphatase [Rubripirellula sp.]
MIRAPFVFLWTFVCLPIIFAQDTSVTPTNQSAKTDSGSSKATKVDPSDAGDPIREMQSLGIKEQKASWGHWGVQPDRYSTWTNHSNRLIPVYTFGITLSSLRDEGSVYSDPKRLKKLYGRVPEGSVNPTAMYYDQTDIYRLQQAAVEAGYSNIILMVFDGMDWQTTRAAALYKAASQKRRHHFYSSGRGTGLMFQDDRRIHTDFGLICTSPMLSGVKLDVNAQTVVAGNEPSTGGYDPSRGGEAPWLEQSQRDYLIGLDRERLHTVTDSASSATSMTCGIKTANGAINVKVDGTHVIPIARELQSNEEFKVGIVTSVPVSHATPAAAYANNVTRKDYQDISRDLIGLPSSSHRKNPLPGVDVLLGAGWGEGKGEDKLQGDNFMAGNPYLHQDDIRRVDQKQGGEYVVVQRTKGKSGRKRLMSAARRAADEDSRLLGFFGTKGGHLPFRTADGKYNPTFDVKGTEKYSPEEVSENPTVAEMTQAALLVLEQAIDGFWLLVEAGDVDWANHANNIDNSVGAVLSGDEAFEVVMDWVDENNAWSYTAVIVTADHGHYLVIEDAERFVEAGQSAIKKAK